MPDFNPLDPTKPSYVWAKQSNNRTQSFVAGVFFLIAVVVATIVANAFFKA